MGSEYQRKPVFPISQLAGSIPVCTIDDDVDAASVARTALIHLQHLDSNLFLHDGLWRDLCAFTGSLRTLAGADRILEAWNELSAAYQPHRFALIPGVRVVKPGPKTQWIEARFRFVMTQDGLEMNCEGIMRLVTTNQFDWKIWTLATLLKNVDNWGDVDNLDPIKEPGSKAKLNLTTDNTKHFQCIVVGAGFSGLCIAGRLHAIGVEYLVIDRAHTVGDVWAARYPSVRIHTGKDHGQFPFKTRMWGEETPYHLSPVDLRRGYQKFVDTYDINVQLNTNLAHATWNKTARRWSLEISKQGKTNVITCQHLVFAIGSGQTTPVYPPNLVGQERYNGTVLHSVDYSTSDKWRGLKGAVVGSANSGHDITKDMVEAGLHPVTMVQRGRTPVLPVKFYRNIYDAIYNDKADITLSDQLSMSAPTAIARLMAMKAISNMAATTPENYAALEQVGFRVEPNMDLYHCLYERFGSHYIDVGVSKMISDGKIKVKAAPPGAGLTGFYEHGLEFEDGSKLEADVVVFTTGFDGNMRLAAEKLLDPEISHKLEDWWGVDNEGELRGGWRPMAQPGIWFTGGNVALARFFSRFLALQIKADVVGSPFKLYDDHALNEARAES